MGDELSAFEETNLSHVKTLEPMTPTDVAKTEILRSRTLESVTSFDKTTLKTTMTEDKNVNDDNATKGIRAEIESFDTESLQPVETIEKLAVPDPIIINQEIIAAMKNIKS